MDAAANQGKARHTMKTHFAAVHAGIVIGSRSSASRHVGGSGKFGPYTHAAAVNDNGELGILTWHGTAAAAADSVRTWSNRGRLAFVVLVAVTPKRLAVGSTIAEVGL